MGFSGYPKLFEVRTRELSRYAQSFEEFEGDYTTAEVESYNAKRAAFIRGLHGGEPIAGVEVAPFRYSNGDYEGSGIVYRPKAGGKLPVAVYIHGGGWTTLSKECYEYECATFAREGRCAVFSIDYRLAIGGTKFPTCQEDCFAALLAIAEGAADFGADATRIAVMGDSAGGTLAAGTALMARDRKGPPVACQILCYPGVGFDLEDDGADASITKRLMDACLARPEDAKSPYVSPILDARKESTPPTMLVVGSCDFLLDDDLRYAKALADAGVDVDFELFQGMPHGFIQMTTPPGREAVFLIAERLKGALH